VPAGTYDVTVTEGADSATCTGCLRVTEATTPAAPPAAPEEGTPTASVEPTLPAAPPSTTAPTAAPPRLVIVRRPVVIRGHRVRLTVRCTGGACRGAVTGTVARKTVTTKRFTLASGATRTVTLRLNRNGRALLKRTGRIRVALTIIQRRANGAPQAIRTTRITLRSRPARRR
jgi:hypothetical protein